MAAVLKGANSNGVALGFEAELFKAADKMRGSMEASEYKRVFGPCVPDYNISDASDLQQLTKTAEAIEWILDLLQHEAEAVNPDGKSDKQIKQEKKKVHRKYNDAVLALSKAFALAAATEAAKAIREEMGFFQAVRAALVKNRESNGKNAVDRELAIQQIVSRSVCRTTLSSFSPAALTISRKLLRMLTKCPVAGH